MARGRMLNRDVSISPKLDALKDDTTRLLATWTIPHLDKNGVFHATPAIVRAHVFPLRDISAQAVAEMLDDMERVGLIRRFTAAGRTWQAWPGFLDNQRGFHAERERTDFPPPPAVAGVLPEAAGVLPATDQQLLESAGKSGPEVQVQIQQQTTPPETGPEPAPAPFPEKDVDPFTEAARRAGLGNTPSYRSKTAKAAAKKREEDRFDLNGLSEHPAIVAYFKTFQGIPLPRNLAEMIASAVGDVNPWDATCREWAKGNPVTGKTWNPLAIDKMLILYAAKCAQVRAGQNGAKTSAPAFTPEQLAEIEGKLGATL